MTIVALISRKGGCGKSTLATNIAAYFASRKLPIALGDLDHQQSAHAWLGRRPATAPAIVGWVGDTNAQMRPPVGIAHQVIDTPGGLHGFALSKVVMLADAILIPVSGSAFDRQSTADFWAELRVHPRVKSGHCQVACMGMRLDNNTDAAKVTREWAASIKLPWLGYLRSAQVYVRATENGMSLFDMPSRVSLADREQWKPLLEWLKTQFARSTSAERQEKLMPCFTPSQPAGLQRTIPREVTPHSAAAPLAGRSPNPMRTPADAALQTAAGLAAATNGAGLPESIYGAFKKLLGTVHS
jgi:chromosome partitioning protein